MALDERIAALKSIMHTERDFSVLMHRFMDILEAGDDLHEASVPAAPCVDLAATLARVAESSLRRRVAIARPLWRAVPSLHLGFALMRINGHLTTAFYFSDIGCGLIGICVGYEVKYSRFRLAVDAPLSVVPSRN